MPHSKKHKKKKKSTQARSEPQPQDLKSLLGSLSECDFTQADTTTKLVMILTRNEYRKELASDEKTVHQVRDFIRRAYQNEPENIESLFKSKNCILAIAASAISRKLKHIWCHCFIEGSRARTHSLVSKINNTRENVLRVQTE